MAFACTNMPKLTKHTTFDALKEAADNPKKTVANKEKLNAEAQQAAVILNELRAQRYQGNARK